MPKLEREVEGRLKQETERRGGLCPKFSPDHARGWPDRLVLLPGGTICWVETKRPRGGRLSPAQLVAHETLRRLGQRVEVVRTEREARELVAELTGDVDPA